ncbi:T9SS type A sorting domain-containing protein [Pontibacter toksunensis]|uniref:T9SS type A sorting domain-containing protein n=1 Tax=Pontibacter toksunensis TaxID=1332631 RepID=A0ABW6BZB8_9BACT
MKKFLTLFLFTLCAVATAVAQQQEPVAFRFRHDVPVTTPAGQLAAPWSGGLNTPQFSTIDLNKDGQEDLFIFDRQLKKVYTWLAVQQNGKWQYQYAPAYDVFFPADLEYWVLLRDYNCDGLKDIFTSSPLGMRVFKQETATAGQLKFTLSEEALFYRDGKVNIQMKSTDIPGIADIDNDGDLDVLIAEFSRGYTLELYQNMQAEQGLACGTMKYEQQTNWWGGITECDGCNSYLFGAHCRVAAPLHSGHDGTSLLLLDMDADGDKELVMGSVTCDNLVLMENEGTSATALMTGFTPAFPAAKPASFPIFPAAFYEDVTFDGVPDMLVASQATDDLVDINFETATWLYRNQGAANQPDFAFVQDDFLQGQMIDVGEGAFPAFADMDADGDMDMLVGNATAFRDGRYSAALHFYLNTGTANSPAFELVTKDYLGLQSQQLSSIKPAFVDMNGDGAADLVLTFKDIQANATRITYIANKALRGQAAVYSFADLKTVQDVQADASPAFADIDDDGDPDMLLGMSDGSLSFYRNTGNAASTVYALEKAAFGGIVTDFTRRYLYPAVADVDGNGIPDLLTTDASGELRVYRNLPSALQGNKLYPETELVENELLDGLQKLRLGKGSSIAVAPLGGENKLYLTLGTQGGGLYLLEQSAGNSAEPTVPEAGLKVEVFPNPADRSTREIVRVKASEPVTVQVYDSIGKLLYRSTVGNYSRSHMLPLQNLKAGLYIIRATSQSGKRTSSKFVVR